MPPSDTATDYVTVRAAAELAGVSTHTIRRWVTEGRLPATVRVVRSLRVSRADLAALAVPVARGGER